MDFQINKEQQLILKAVREICNKYPNSYWRELDSNKLYPEDFVQDLIMYGSDDNSMLETKTDPFSSFGGADNKINDTNEMLILFYWNGDFSSPIQDVDYFLWGNNQNAIDKSDVPGYQSDTSADDQLFFEEIAENYYAYSRIGTDEIGETDAGGNFKREIIVPPIARGNKQVVRAILEWQTGKWRVSDTFK